MIGTIPQQTEKILKAIEDYERLLERVARSIQSVYDEVGSFWEDFQLMSTRLQENLAAGDRMRRKDFSLLMGSNLQEQRQKQQHLASEISSFLSREREFVRMMKEMVNLGQCSPEEVALLKERMIGSRQARQKKICSLLMELRIEQLEMTAAIKRLLARGSHVRARELKRTLRELEFSRTMRLSLENNPWKGLWEAWWEISRNPFEAPEPLYERR